MKLIVLFTAAFCALAGADEPRLNAGEKAFQTTLYPQLRAHCFKCHDGKREYRLQGEIVAGPAFASANMADSYDRMKKKYVRFDDVPKSLLVRRGGNMHCLNDYEYDCKLNKDDLRKAIEEWWDKGEKEVSAPRVATEALDVPVSPEPPKQGVAPPFIAMRWDLEKASGVKGAILEVEVQRFHPVQGNARGAIRLRKPRIGVPGKSLLVSDLRILVNGKEESSANAFIEVDTIISSSEMPGDNTKPLPFPVLSPSTMIVLQDKGDEKLGVSFGQLKVADGPARCKDLDTFKKKVLPVMEIRKCSACHGGGPKPSIRPAAQARFNMAVKEDQLCAGVLQRTNVKHPSRSVFVHYALKGANGHPRVIPRLDELEPDFSEWLKKEAADTGNGTGSGRLGTAPPIEEIKD